MNRVDLGAVRRGDGGGDILPELFGQFADDLFASAQRR